MRRLRFLVLLGIVLLSPVAASAGNSDEVNAGLDVTLTGGAVVANVYTGASLWYNPAGLARIDKPSFELTGVTLQLQVIKNPGLVTIETDPPAKSEGSGFNFSVIPQAITFTLKLRNDNVKLGIGLFNSSIRRAFLTEQAVTPSGGTPSVRTYAGRNSKLDFLHISSGVAGTFGGKRGGGQSVLLGGALDLVVASSRTDSSFSLLYDDGVSGLVSSGETATQTGFGFQLKGGIQWVPIPKIRVGLSVASPTYVFAAIERFANSYTQAPPAGTPPGTTDPLNAQLADGDEGRGVRGVWWGVEPGNLRLGLAYIGDWGWVEGDLVVSWRLREPEVGLDLRGFVNGRLGSAFRLSKNVKLGVGAFTDFSQVDQLARLPLATQKVDFFGVHLGFLYATQEVHPDKQVAEEDKEGLDLSIAVGLRYAHGRGDTLGLSIPAIYDPSGIQDVTVATKMNEISINIAAKVGF